MIYQFALTGGYTVTPLDGVLSLAPNVNAIVDEPLLMSHIRNDDVDLTVDTPVAVNFGGVASAHVIVLKAIGGPVVARVTSAAGVQQSIPFDTFLILMSTGSPATALDLTRQPATPTTVQVLLGEKA